MTPVEEIAVVSRLSASLDALSEEDLSDKLMRFIHYQGELAAATQSHREQDRLDHMALVAQRARRAVLSACGSAA